ncbi:MAG: ABC transporter ATP-binding protein [Legionellaceae bacterium]|nr:ABC transporter ATP-binding protein [Legionellaceae bacterium]
MRPLKNLRLICNLLRDLLRFHRMRTCVTFFLMLMRSVTSGVGLLLILPLLQLIGLSLGPSANTGITTSVRIFFEALHLPMSLVSMLCLYTLIVSVLAVLSYAEQVTSAALQRHYTKYLRATLHQQLLQTPWPFFLERKMSDVLYSLTTQVQGIALCNYQLLTLMNHVLLIVVYTGLACFLSFKMTLLAVLCALILLSFMLPLHHLTSRAGGAHLQKNQLLFQAISEQFAALKMIQGSALETRFVKQLVDVNEALEGENAHLSIMTARSKLLYACASVVLLSGLLYAALTVFNVPLATLLLLLIVFSRVLPMVSSSQQMYQRILHQLPAYIAIQALLHDCKRARKSVARDTKKIIFDEHIVFQNVCFAYPSKPDCMVLQDVSFTLPKNSTTAIVGPSGVGKSTLADVLVGLLQPMSGDIWIDNERLQSDNNAAWRERIAYVTQDVFLFNASVRDNLTWFSQQQADDALWDVLDLAAADFVRHLDEGLDTMLGDRGVRLSGGERQRIALARALLMKPALLVLDESTSSLDAENIQKIQQALSQLSGKLTIVVISHQDEMCAFAHHSIVLTQANTHKKEGVHDGEEHVVLDAHKATIV